MLRIALAGGVGSGKSTAATHLRSLGFPVLDADDASRAVMRQGQPAWIALRDAFGRGLLQPDGEIDRAFLAELAFADPTALRRLNMITHGFIGRYLLDQLAAVSAPVVFVALPLFRSEHREFFQLDQAWALMVSPETALDRLVRHRAMSERDARARLAHQMSNEQRATLVDRVLWNEGTVTELNQALDVALREIGVIGG